MSSSAWIPISGVARTPPTHAPNGNSNPIISYLTKRPIWSSKVPNNVEWVGIPFPPFNRKTTSAIPDVSNASSSTASPSGGDFDAGDTAFVLISTALVFLMIPGLGFFYSGLIRGKNAISIILLCCWSVAVVSIQWFIIGYSLTFSRTGSFFIGNFDHLFLQGVYDDPSPLSAGIPSLLFCIYQGMFAAITPALAIGSGAERHRFLPTTIFIFLWTTFAYDFIAYWTWNPNGWWAMLGGLDFAGGTPVHIASGAAALAYALVLGKREKTEEFKPHNLSYVFLGTALLWFGWFGFNGGSALSPSTQAINACLVTNLSASMGGIVWLILDYRHAKKYSPLAFCSGAVAGLVTITPACGYVSPPSSLVFGAVGALFCHIAVSIKPYLCQDDAVDVFEVHGVGGIVGNILTGVFAQKAYAPATEGGGLDCHWIQVCHQLTDTVCGFLWSFVISLIILLVMNCIPGLRLRVDKEAERVGVDNSEMGANAYEFVEQVKLTNAQQLQFATLGSKCGMQKQIHPANQIQPQINQIQPQINQVQPQNSQMQPLPDQINQIQPLQPQIRQIPPQISDPKHSCPHAQIDQDNQIKKQMHQHQILAQINQDNHLKEQIHQHQINDLNEHIMQCPYAQNQMHSDMRQIQHQIHAEIQQLHQESQIQHRIHQEAQIQSHTTPQVRQECLQIQCQCQSHLHAQHPRHM